MYLRLAFAVAAHLEPEILVVDEVLAVGDAEFQRKCLGKMSDVAQRGAHGPVRQPQHVGHSAPDRRDAGDRERAPGAASSYSGGGGLLPGQRVLPARASGPGRRTRSRLKQNLSGRSPCGSGIRGTDGRYRPLGGTHNIEVEYGLARRRLPGCGWGSTLMNTRGEHAFTSFDMDDPCEFERLASVPPGIISAGVPSRRIP